MLVTYINIRVTFLRLGIMIYDSYNITNTLYLHVNIKRNEGRPQTCGVD